MVDRIKLLLSVKNLTSAQLAQTLGVQRSGISHILSGRNKPSLDFVLKMMEHFPEINEIWLLKGEGEMMKANTKPDNNLFIQDNSSEIQEQLLENNEIEEKHHLKDEDVQVYQKLSNPFKDKKADLVSNKDSVHSERDNPFNTSDAKRKKILKVMTFYEDMSFDVYYPA